MTPVTIHRTPMPAGQGEGEKGWGVWEEGLERSQRGAEEDLSGMTAFP